LIDTLVDAKAMQVAGVLGPAGVVELADGVLTLEYDSDHEGLRRRGEKMIGDINEVLTALAGMPILCKLQAGDGADAQRPVRRAFGGLSAAETAEIAEDPAVKALLDAFKGTVMDTRRDPLAGLATEVEPEEDVGSERH
jgi:hypothetical protein